MKKFSLIGTAIFAAACAITLAASPASSKGTAVCFPEVVHYPNRPCVDTAKPLMQELKRIGYPGVIIGRTKKDYKYATTGWKSTDCRLSAKRWPMEYDYNIHKYKFFYCELTARGFDVPLPTFRKGY